MAIVELKSLVIGYAKKALSEPLNAEVERGQLIIVAGRNGSGKSTLLRTLCGLQPKIDGDVLLNGQSISALSNRERSKQVALVLSQAPLTTSLKVAEVIALGAWPAMVGESDDRIVQLLDRFGLRHRANYPLDQISDGERQKAMIARALMQNTPILVMDEPTAFLDLPSSMQWWKDINILLGEGLTVIVSTHDLHYARRYGNIDRFWVMRSTPNEAANMLSIDGDASEEELFQAMG
jgi:iron complex transport system ATP-binding protein